MFEQSVINDLLTIQGVEGALLSNANGEVLARRMPDHMNTEQMQAAANLINQNRGAASSAVGNLKYCEFRYHDKNVFIYYLNHGQLLLLCSAKVNPERTALEVSLLSVAIEKLLADLNNHSTAPQSAKYAIPSPTASRSEAQSEIKKSRGKGLTALITAAVIVILLLGGGFFFLLGKTTGTQQLTTKMEAHAGATGASAQEAKTVAVEEFAAITPAHQPAETILRLHGSNTIGAKLGPALAEEFLKKKLKGMDIVAISAGIPDEQSIEGTLPDGRRVAVEIHAHGSTTSFKGLNEEVCDIGMASRSIKSKEVDMLSRFGDMTSTASENVLALDGIAVIVHPANAVSKLSQQQIADIFTGKTADWSELPESHLSGAIRVIARDEKSGTWDTFKSLVLHGEALKATAQRIEDSRVLTESVADNKNAIGFIGLPYIKPSKAISVSETGTAAVFPTVFTVATEDYPLARRLYLYLPQNTASPLSRSFVEFALSMAGQDIVHDIGFVELTIDKQQPEIPANAPAQYLSEVNTATRLSLNFRFRIGSSTIDNKGLRDIDRLIAFLNTPENRNRSIKLFGFADNIGARDVNCRLAEGRAQQVAEQLSAYGIRVSSVQGFCDDMPVASNLTAAGREKNRRVEVWLEQ